MGDEDAKALDQQATESTKQEEPAASKDEAK